jgi:hypothetical protein
MCTNWLGAVNGNAADGKQRVALKILGRSFIERQLAFAAEHGWLITARIHEPKRWSWLAGDRG